MREWEDKGVEGRGREGKGEGKGYGEGGERGRRMGIAHPLFSA